MKSNIRLLLIGIKFVSMCAIVSPANAAYSTPPSPEIVSAWKLNSENAVMIFRHDGVFYFIDGISDQLGMERGTFEWDKDTGNFSVDVIVDTNGDAGLSHPGAATTISITGNTLNYTVAGEGTFSLSRVVNTTNAIVGSWHIPGEDTNLTFLADGTYYHSEEYDNAPDSTTGMERGTYTWNSTTGVLTATPISDTNGDIGLSHPTPSFTATITGNSMSLFDGQKTYMLRRVTPNIPSLNTEPDFEVDQIANYHQTGATAPSLLPTPVAPGDDHPFTVEAYLESTVSGSGGTLTITGQTAQNFLNTDGWAIVKTYNSLSALNAASAFPNGASYTFSRTGGSATLSYPANGTFSPAPTIVSANENGVWDNGVFVLGKNQTLIWNAHTDFDPNSLATVLTVVNHDTSEEVMKKEVIQGDIISYDFRGKLTKGVRYDVTLEHVKIASSTTSGTGPFASKLGYALYFSSTRFAMASETQPVVDYVILEKSVLHQQIGSDTVILDPTPLSAINGGPFGFITNVEGQNMASLPAPTVTPPPGTPSSPQDPFYGTLFFDADDELAWRYGPVANDWGELSQANIDARFPNGTYTFLVDGVSVPLTLTGDRYPNIPQMALTGGSWINGKYAIDAANPITITTNAFTDFGSNLDGLVELKAGASEFVSFHSTSPAANSASLNLPANTLPTNEITMVNAFFAAIVDKNNVIPNVLSAAFYSRELKLEIHVLPRIDSQPASQVMQPNTTVNLSITASGSPTSPGGSMLYQWKKNGVVLLDETSPTLGVLADSAAIAGTYTCTVSNEVGSATTDPIILEYADAYQAYAASFSLNSATDGAPDGDLDGDGIDNLLEFVLGGSPSTVNPNLLKTATTTPAAIGRNLVFYYDRKSAASSVNVVIETSSSLTGTWTPAFNGVNGVVVSTSALDGNTQRVTATIPSQETHLFVRLRASR